MDNMAIDPEINFISRNPQDHSKSAWGRNWVANNRFRGQYGAKNMLATRRGFWRAQNHSIGRHPTVSGRKCELGKNKTPLVQENIPTHFGNRVPDNPMALLGSRILGNQAVNRRLPRISQVAPKTEVSRTTPFLARGVILSNVTSQPPKGTQPSNLEQTDPSSTHRHPPRTAPPLARLRT